MRFTDIYIDPMQARIRLKRVTAMVSIREAGNKL